MKDKPITRIHRKDSMYPNEPARQPRRLSFRGKNLTIREWIKEIEKTDGIKLTVGCIQTRLSYEWSIEKTLTTPPRKSWPISTRSRGVIKKDGIVPI